MKFSELDSIFKKLASPDAPGCALGIYRYGRPVYLRGFGSKRMGAVDPIGPQTIFNIGSVSKQFTAFCILLLQERGLLGLEDKIRKYFTEFPPRFDGIKVRHLMHHSSGTVPMGDLLWDQACKGLWKPGGQDHLRLIAMQSQFNFPAGLELCYNNDGYFLLGQIVQRVSGQSLASFAAKNIFQPLGMSHTRYLEDGHTWIPELAEGHSQAKGKFKPAPKTFFSPGPGDVWSSLEDLGLWDRDFYKKSLGGTKLYRTQIQAAQLRRSVPGAGGYAAGLCLNRFRGHAIVTHNGADTGFCADYWRIPSKGWSVICLFNREWYFGQEFMTVVNALLGKPSSQAKARLANKAMPKKLVPLEGHYESADSPALWALKRKGRHYFLNPGDKDIALAYNGKGALVGKVDAFTDFHLQIDLRPDGAIQLLQTRQGKLVRRLRYVGQASEKNPLPPGLAGYYRDPRSGSLAQLQSDDGKIYWRDPSAPAQVRYQLVALSARRLVVAGSGGWCLEFERDAEGKVCALSGWAPEGRIKRLRWERIKSRGIPKFQLPKAKASWRKESALYAYGG